MFASPCLELPLSVPTIRYNVSIWAILAFAWSTTCLADSSSLYTDSPAIVWFLAWDNNSLTLVTILPSPTIFPLLSNLKDSSKWLTSEIS